MIAGMKKQLAILLSALLIAMALPAQALAATQTEQQSQSGVKNVSVELNAKKAKAGWKKVGKKWKYRTSSGKYLKSCFKTIKGKKYRFNSKGYRCTGWITVKGKKYYANSKGVIAKGWRTIKGYRYYFSKSTGALQGKGFKELPLEKPTDYKFVGTWYIVATSTSGADGLVYSPYKSASNSMSVSYDGTYKLKISGSVYTGKWKLDTVKSNGTRYYNLTNDETGRNFFYAGVFPEGDCIMLLIGNTDVSIVFER